jgi:hypothetical protein
LKINHELKINENQSLAEGKSVKIEKMDELKHVQRREVHLGCITTMYLFSLGFSGAWVFSSWAAENLTNRYDQILRNNAISRHQLDKIARVPTLSD